MRRASRLVNWLNLYRLFGKFSIEPSRKQVSANISTDLRGIERGSIFEDIDKYRACDVWTNSDRTLFRKNRWLKIRNRTNILPGYAKCEAFLKLSLLWDLTSKPEIHRRNFGWIRIISKKNIGLGDQEIQRNYYFAAARQLLKSTERAHSRLWVDNLERGHGRNR